MVEEGGLELPDPVEVKGMVLERHQLLALGEQFDQIPHHILEVLVAAIVVHHSFDHPLIPDFIIQHASEHPPVK